MSLPSRPCGTVAELEAMNLNPAAFPTCAPPEGTKFPGCSMWRFCQCTDRDGRAIKAKAGPVFYGVKIVKRVPGRGVGKTQDVLACHVYTQLRHQIRANGGLCQVIGYEGDEIEVRGSRKVAPDVAAGAEPGAWTWQTVVTKVRVPKHPRPHELPELQDLTFLEKSLQEEAVEQEARESRVLGRAAAHKDARDAAAAADKK